MNISLEGGKRMKKKKLRFSFGVQKQNIKHDMMRFWLRIPNGLTRLRLSI